MKKVYKNLSLALVLLSVVSVLVMSPLSAIAIDAAQAPDKKSYTIQAQSQWTNRWQGQNTNVNISNNAEGKTIRGEISLTPGISDKDFGLDIDDAPGDLSLNMTCTEEQEELGLLNGNRVTARNRNRYRFQEQFVVNISCNCSQIQAKLRIRATEQNRNGYWAFYNGSAGEWESVQTQTQNGYLVANTTHFSTWTILVPEAESTIDPLMVVGIIVGVVAVIAIVGAVGYIYKKR